MYNLVKSDLSGGASGVNSWRINKNKENNTYTNQHPIVGSAILVGDPNTDNWWRTNVITEIITENKGVKDDVIEVTFRTESGSIYTWSIND